jgi:hypothetical protein
MLRRVALVKTEAILHSHRRENLKSYRAARNSLALATVIS